MVYSKHFLLAALLSTSVIVRAQDECAPCCPAENAERCEERRACAEECPCEECPCADRKADNCAADDRAQECNKGGCCDSRSEATTEEQVAVAPQAETIHLEAVVHIGEEQQLAEINVVPGQQSLINVAGKELVFVAQVQPVADNENEVDIAVALYERTEDEQAKEHGRCTVRRAWGQRTDITCEGSDLKLFLTARRA